MPKIDGRKNNGGHSTAGKAGRKSKSDEEKIKSISLNAIKNVFGSEEKAFESIAQQAKTSFPHLKLLFEYTYGKPRETKDINLLDSSINVTINGSTID